MCKCTRTATRSDGAASLDRNEMFEAVKPGRVVKAVQLEFADDVGQTRKNLASGRPVALGCRCELPDRGNPFSAWRAYLPISLRGYVMAITSQAICNAADTLQGLVGFHGKRGVHIVRCSQ